MSLPILTYLLSGPNGSLDTFVLSCNLDKLLIERDIIRCGGYKAILVTKSGETYIVRVGPTPKAGYLFNVEILSCDTAAIEVYDQWEGVSDIYSRFSRCFKNVVGLDPYLFQ